MTIHAPANDLALREYQVLGHVCHFEVWTGSEMGICGEPAWGYEGRKADGKGLCREHYHYVAFCRDLAGRTYTAKGEKARTR